MNRIRYLLPLLLLAYFAHGKLELNPQPRFERMSDGLFYYQIAQHVAAGEGLLTSVSLYSQGLQEMPTPTTVQPLWPLVVGWSGRWIGLDRAAEWVPELLYFVVLLLLYSLGNRVGRSLGSEILLAPRGVPILDLGTLAVAIFGSNAAFFSYTSKTYTEGLALSLLLASLLALPSVASRRLVLRGALAGALAGLTYLTRSQFLGASVAIAVALGLFGLRTRPLRRAAVASICASVAVVLPWVVFLVTSLPRFTPGVFVNFAAYRETPELRPLVLGMQFSSPGERLADLLGSLVYAFDPMGQFSYFVSFGPVLYAVPVFALLFGWRLVRGPNSLEATTNLEHLAPAACLLVAASTLAPLHAAHMAVGYEWLFFWRHGLPMILCIVPAIAWLARFHATLRWAVLVAAAIGVVFPLRVPTDYDRSNDYLTWPAEVEFMRWLDAHPERPVVLTTMSRSVAAQSHAVAHGLVCTDPGFVVEQVEALPVDYLVVYALTSKKCGLVLQRLPLVRFELVKIFGEGGDKITVLRLRPS